MSPVFAVDLQSLAGGLTVSGRVLAAATRQPLSGASVSLAGQNTTTAGDGTFSLANISLTSGNTLTVSKSGFLTDTETPSVPPGSKSITLADILLPVPPSNNVPVVIGVSAARNPFYLSGVSTPIAFTASVNWNNSSPGNVIFYANDQGVQALTGAGPTYTATLDSSAFSPSLAVGANRVKVVAQNGAGQSSTPSYVSVLDLPYPAPLALVFPPGGFSAGAGDLTLSAEADWPTPPISTPTLSLGPLGSFGMDFKVNPHFMLDLSSGEWELSAGNLSEAQHNAVEPDSHNLTLYLGQNTLQGDVRFGGSGTLSPTAGFTDTKVFIGLSLSDKFPLGEVGLVDLLGPGLSSLASDVPVVGGLVKSVSIQFYATPEIGGDVYLNFPSLQFDSADFGGSIAITAEYEPDLGKLGKFKVYVGGKPSVLLQVPPQPPGGFLKEAEFEAYAGVEWEIWVFTFSGEYVFLDLKYPSDSARSLAHQLTSGGGWMLVPACSPGLLRFVARPNLLSGPEVFVAMGDAKSEAVTGRRPSSLDSFRLIGQAPVRGSVMPESPAKGESGGPAYSPKDLGDPDSGTNQVDLTLVQNAFPGSSPALAAWGPELMLLYVTDNGITNNLQYTDIAWTRWDGTNWSVPLAIRTNTQAEFAPQVAYDGNGDAIAVWERVADPNFNQTNLTAMAAHMEIVWSRWSRTNGAWSEPAALTANSYLDHAPLLCGPMSDGSVLAVWTANQQNLLIGTNAPGDDTVLWAEWSAASRAWSAPRVLVDGLAYRLSQSLAGAGGHAVYAWTRDADGVLTNDTDQEVFFMEYTNSAWGASRQLTTNTVADKTVCAAVATNGNVFLVWQSGTNLVMSKNFSTNASLVRPDSQTAGFADYALALGPAGNLVLIWQEMSTNGSDAHYMVYDPVADVWGKDDLLCQDPPLERSFAPVWDNVGNLTVAYDKVQIFYTNKTVTVEGGGTVTITNVPQPGRVDLVVTKRALVKDLALLSGDFTVQGVNYLPGDPLTLSATVHNSGNVAMSNVVVGFYDGSPATGGVLLTNVTLPGWLAAATSAVASTVWVVPDPATNHTLYAAANWAGLASEFNWSNNVASVSISGTDLAVSLVGYSAETNGAMRVIAQVQNLGAPSATNSVLAIRRYGPTNAPLATVAVPTLEPGRLAQLALDLPAGTQPAGEQIYTLTADETHVTGDVNTNNNTSSFAVNLWIDSDGDGIPDNWMMQYFGHATGQASDLSLAQDDADGDGMSNLAEYLAGTNPKDAHSYLSITGIGVGGTNGVQIRWGSASNKLYSLQRAVALSGGLGFTNIAEHILSTPPENVYLDATATNSPSLFYRVKVE
jgi:hypothetical protein